MKKFINALIAGALAICSVSAMAADYWSADNAGLQQCEAAVKGPGVNFYTPKLKNPVEKGEILDTFSSQAPGCIITYATREDGTRGMATVAVDKGSIKKLASGRKVWTECHNLVINYLTVIFGSQKSELTRQNIPATQALQLERDKCDVQCQAVDVCQAEKGTLQSLNGVMQCVLPIERMTLIQPFAVEGRVESRFTGWQQPVPLNVPSAPAPQVNVARPHAPVVTAQSCSTQGCSSRPVANFVSEVKADYCGIRTTDGRLFKLGHDKTSGLVTVTDFTNGEGSGYARMILGGITGNDCDKVQEVIEKKVWLDMTKHFQLPSSCAVAQKVGVVNNKISQYKN